MPRKAIINGQIATIRSEQEMRAGILKAARTLNCEQEVLQIFNKYDSLLRNCTNPIERQAISIEANEQLHFFMSSKPGFLLVGNQIIGKE